MNRYIWMGLLATLLGLVGCNNTGSIEEHFKLAPSFKAYFESNIYSYTDTPHPLPDSLQGIAISAKSEEIAHYRDSIWQVWQKAMAKEIKRLGFANPQLPQTPLVWNIPQGQRMKVAYIVKGERPKEGYPLFINLHGGGKDPNAMGPWSASFNDQEWEAAKTLGTRYQDAPSLYLVPRMADDRIGRWYLAPQRSAFSRAVRAAIASGWVNPHRIYLLGISEGGYGSHRLAMFGPDKFTAFGPMAGAEPMNDYKVNLRNTALRLEVGELDAGFKRAEFAQLWQTELAKLATENPGLFKHEVVIQKGRGHGINYYNTAPWLAQQQHRTTYPQLITYAFHYLEGFPSTLYYLDLSRLTFPDNNARPYLACQHEGNSYHLTLEGEGQPTGTLRIYLHEAEVNLAQPITITLNGKEIFHKTVTPTLGAFLESATTFADPLRLFPAYVDVALNE